MSFISGYFQQKVMTKFYETQKSAAATFLFLDFYGRKKVRN